MSERLWIPIGVAILLIVATAAWWLQDRSSPNVVIATGTESGIYHHVGSEIGRSFSHSNPGLNCTITPSAGSAENIARLEDGVADVAIIQNDAIASERVRSLAMLYTETLHLIASRDLKIECLNDLVDHRTNVGSKSSGTYQLVSELLSFSRIKLSSPKRHEIGFEEAEAMLKEGELDAGFFLVGVGADVVQRLLTNDRFELVPIQIRVDGIMVSERDFVEGFQTQYPYAIYSSIPLMAYEGKPNQPIPSVGIGAILACRNDWDGDLARGLIQAVFAHKAVLGRQIPLLSGLDETSSQSALQFPLHPGADDYFRRNEPGFLAENAESIGLLLTLTLLAASGLHGVKKWIDQSRKNRVDVFYQQVQDIQTLALQSTDGCADCFQRLYEVEAQACEELIQERLDADHTYVILQNMISRCRGELDRQRFESEREQT